jgi:hypothetical protein
MRLYPPHWRERYGEEFEALLLTSRGDLRTLANVGWSALRERIISTAGFQLDQGPRPSQFQSWCVRAPWALFGLAPLLFVAGAYFIACLILWSGWRIFLPGTNTPFVRLDGFAIFYFGVGKFLYYSAPILIGWGAGLIAARQRIKAVWPTVGFVLIAVVSATAQVQASRPIPGGAGHISLRFILGHSGQAWSAGLLHALMTFSLLVLPYLILRIQKVRSLSI